MVSPAEENMRKYRQLKGPMVGGSPYAYGQARHLGWNPQVFPHYFDAYTQIKQAAAGSNFFGSSDKKISNVDAGDEDIQFIARLASPVMNLSQISFPLVHPISYDSDSFTITPNGPGADVFDHSVGVYIRPVGALMVPLAEGAEWGLDALTYGNAAYLDAAAGKLYADAARYKAFPSSVDRIWEATEAGGASTFSFGGTEPTDWAATMTARSHIAHWIEGAADIASAAGPFYGLHFAAISGRGFEIEFRGIQGEGEAAATEALAFVLGTPFRIVEQ